MLVNPKGTLSVSESLSCPLSLQIRKLSPRRGRGLVYAQTLVGGPIGGAVTPSQGSEPHHRAASPAATEGNIC